MFLKGLLADALGVLIIGTPLFLLMLVLRKFVLWYWRIDRAVKALESIAESQQYLAQAEEWKITRVQQSTAATARVAAAGGGSRTRP